MIIRIRPAQRGSVSAVVDTGDALPRLLPRAGRPALPRPSRAVRPFRGASFRKPGPRRSADSRAWTVESVRALGLTTTVEIAASILGISRTKAYTLAKSGEFPVRLVRVGRRYLVPTSALLELRTSGR